MLVLSLIDKVKVILKLLLISPNFGLHGDQTEARTLKKNSLRLSEAMTNKLTLANESSFC